MQKNEKKSPAQQRLDSLEIEFDELLITCLRACAKGRYGLFGQNDTSEFRFDPLRWDDALRLRELADEIHSARLEFGQPNPVCERFLELCHVRGANAPGEPKLAKAFLSELKIKG